MNLDHVEKYQKRAGQEKYEIVKVVKACKLKE